MKTLINGLVSQEMVNVFAKEVAQRADAWRRGGAEPLSFRDDPNLYGVVLNPMSDAEAEVFCHMAEDHSFAESFRKKVSVQLKKLGLTLISLKGDETANLWVDFAATR